MYVKRVLNSKLKFACNMTLKHFPFTKLGAVTQTDFICLKRISFLLFLLDARPARGSSADVAGEREAGSGAGAPGGKVRTLSAPLGCPALRGPAGRGGVASVFSRVFPALIHTPGLWTSPHLFHRQWGAVMFVQTSGLERLSHGSGLT